MGKLNLLKKLNLVINGSILAIIFGVPIYFSFFKEFDDLFVLPKQVFFHLFLIIGLMAFFAKFWLADFKLSFYKIDKHILIATSFLLVSALISTALSIDLNLSLWGKELRQQGLYSYFGYILFFLLIILNINTWEQVKKILLTIYFSSFVVCSIGALEYAGVLNNIYDPRLASSLGQPNYFAHYLVTIIPITIFGLFLFKERLEISLILLLINFQLFSLLNTYSRGAYIAFIFAFMAGILLLLQSSGVVYWQKIKKYLLLIVLVSSFLCLTLLKSNDPFLNRLSTSFSLSSGSNAVRMNYWKASVAEIKKMPLERFLFGYGLETQGEILIKHYQPDLAKFEKINSYSDRPHNFILDMILQFGVIGLVLATIFIFSVIKVAFKSLKSGFIEKEQKLVYFLLLSLVAYFVNNLFSFSLATSSIYFFLVLAILIKIPGLNKEIVEIDFSRFSALAKNFVVVLIVFVTFIFYQHDVKVIVSDYYRMEADKAHMVKNCPKMIDSFEKAIKYNPSNVNYRVGYIFYSANCLGKHEAKDPEKILKVIDSLKKETQNYEIIYSIASAYSVLSQVYNAKYFPLALSEYEKMIKINPYFTTAYEDVARLYLWQNNSTMALKYLDKAVKNIPEDDLVLINNEHRKINKKELDYINQLRVKALLSKN